MYKTQLVAFYINKILPFWIITTIFLLQLQLFTGDEFLTVAFVTCFSAQKSEFLHDLHVSCPVVMSLMLECVIIFKFLMLVFMARIKYDKLPVTRNSEKCQCKTTQNMRLSRATVALMSATDRSQRVAHLCRELTNDKLIQPNQIIGFSFLKKLSDLEGNEQIVLICFQRRRQAEKN